MPEGSTPASGTQVLARRLRTGLVPLLISAVLVGAPFPAHAMTLDEYRDGLREIAARVSTLEDVTPGDADALADAIEEALPADESVDLGSVEAPARERRLDRLVQELRDADSEAEIRDVAGQIEDRTGALLDAVGTGETSGVPADADALAAILQKDEPKDGPSLGEWLNEMSLKLAEWIGKLLERLFGGLGDADLAGPDLSGAWPYFLGAAAAVGAGLLVYLLILIVRWRRGRTRKALDEGDDIPVIAAAEDLPPDALGYAERLAAAGRFREAVRALFGGAARTLVEAGIISRAKTRTNGELLSDVHDSAPALAAELGSLAGIFESAWYGRRDPGAGGVERARKHYRAVVSQAARPREESA